MRCKSLDDERWARTPFGTFGTKEPRITVPVATNRTARPRKIGIAEWIACKWGSGGRKFKSSRPDHFFSLQGDRGMLTRADSSGFVVLDVDGGATSTGMRQTERSAGLGCPRSAERSDICALVVFGYRSYFHAQAGQFCTRTRTDFSRMSTFAARLDAAARRVAEVSTGVSGR